MNTPTTHTDSFAERLRKFVRVAQDVIWQHWTTNGFHTDAPILTNTGIGTKYVRIVKEGTRERSAYCFVHIASGDILKAASWMAPAKGSRGNIWSDDYGRSAITPYGARYLRG